MKSRGLDLRISTTLACLVFGPQVGGLVLFCFGGAASVILLINKVLTHGATISQDPWFLKFIGAIGCRKSQLPCLP